ncbi:MAG TPA: hypothetical protein VGE12_18470 [Noviherbaspirillum sp.]
MSGDFAASLPGTVASAGSVAHASETQTALPMYFRMDIAATRKKRNYIPLLSQREFTNKKAQGIPALF